MAIAPVNAASSTSNNWLKEAQDAIAASETSGGMMGALQDSRGDTGSIKTFLAKSQNAMYNLAQISQNSQASAGALYAQMATAAAQKRAADKATMQAKLDAPQTNFTPPAQLDPVIFFSDGSSIDTTSNILTKANGDQVDTTTGLPYIDPASMIQMANGAYLDTKNNILTMADGTKIDTVTGLKITV